MTKWYRCKCCYCGKQIEVKISSKAFENYGNPLEGNACLKCVSGNSPARDGINESAFETRDICDGYSDAWTGIKRWLEDMEAPEQPPEAEPVKYESSKTESVRKEILEAAINCVCTDRDTQYGSPEDSFKVIAKLWSDYTEHEITPHDTAVMMALLKVARIKTGRYKDDSYIDAAGYIACAAEIGRANDE